MKVKKERCCIGRVCIAGGSFDYTYRVVEDMNAQYRYVEVRLFSNYARTWLLKIRLFGVYNMYMDVTSTFVQY